MVRGGVQDSHKSFGEFMKIFNDYDVPVAITFGNHDTEAEKSRSDLRRIFDETIVNTVDKTDCLIIEDRENYTLPIYDEINGEVQNVIFILDSGAESPLNIGDYNWNQPEQVNWLRKTCAKYHQGDRIKRHLIFQHIPIPEYWESSEHITSGVNYETNEKISSPKLNTGLFANMILAEEVWGMFVGHDHVCRSRPRQ